MTFSDGEIAVTHSIKAYQQVDTLTNVIVCVSCSCFEHSLARPEEYIVGIVMHDVSREIR